MTDADIPGTLRHDRDPRVDELIEQRQQITAAPRTQGQSGTRASSNSLSVTPLRQPRSNSVAITSDNVTGADSRKPLNTNNASTEEKILSQSSERRLNNRC